jgi:hypothetical protein
MKRVPTLGLTVEEWCRLCIVKGDVRSLRCALMIPSLVGGPRRESPYNPLLAFLKIRLGAEIVDRFLQQNNTNRKVLFFCHFFLRNSRAQIFSKQRRGGCRGDVCPPTLDSLDYTT